jgi:4-amino-4-deoxy-L-arabinose transferase-like glycosyltransferase
VTDSAEPSPRLVWGAWSALLLLAVALVTAPWHGHVDDDAQLYLVVARHIAAGDGWLDLRYLPGVYDHFREHLPFGLWPAAVVIRLFGEWALGPLAALWTLGTVALVGWLGTRLGGVWVGLLAAVVLVTTDSFWFYGGRFLLDPPLLFFGTASALPLLLPELRASGWLLATACAAAAALVKGPFGLLPLPCAAVAAAVVYRQPSRLWGGALATVIAAAPVSAFLLLDKLGSGTWWNGYVVAQLFASASGRRTDGSVGVLYPFATVAGRFWPGLPFALIGGVQAFRSKPDVPRRTERLFAIQAALLLVALCLPQRKWWNHELIAFPALALLAGAGAAPLLQRWLKAQRARTLVIALASAAAVCLVASLAGVGARLLPPPCVTSQELSAPLDRLPPGAPILVVAPGIEWETLANLAAERKVIPWPVTELPEGHDATGPASATVAVALAGTEVRPPWHEVAQARGWEILERPSLTR